MIRSSLLSGLLLVSLSAQAGISDWCKQHLSGDACRSALQRAADKLVEIKDAALEHPFYAAATVGAVITATAAAICAKKYYTARTKKAKQEAGDKAIAERIAQEESDFEAARALHAELNGQNG